MVLAKGQIDTQLGVGAECRGHLHWPPDTDEMQQLRNAGEGNRAPPRGHGVLRRVSEEGVGELVSTGGQVHAGDFTKTHPGLLLLQRKETTGWESIVYECDWELHTTEGQCP